jgi:hypothetical protein
MHATHTELCGSFSREGPHATCTLHEHARAHAEREESTLAHAHLAQAKHACMQTHTATKTAHVNMLGVARKKKYPWASCVVWPGLCAWTLRELFWCRLTMESTVCLKIIMINEIINEIINETISNGIYCLHSDPWTLCLCKRMNRNVVVTRRSKHLVPMSSYQCWSTSSSRQVWCFRHRLASLVID